MCGIAGFNFKIDKEAVFNALHHRGPDERGEFSDEFFSFFHTRLSIRDISNGHQPFRFNEYVIIFNGEIYNHLALRDELKEFNFKTNSDTETLLYLYIKYKEKMFEKIDGMFAFAIYNTKTKKLFLARDRAGKKPLFIYKKGQKFAFASEINVFKFLNLSIDEEDIKFFLTFGFCESGFKEIKEFPAGSFGILDKELKIKSYFDINFCKKYSFKESVSLADELLEKSVKNRLFSSDVEVGAFLSGGIDSSLIVAKASEFKKLKTFTVRFDGSYDESTLAKKVAEKYNTEHYTIDIDIDLTKIKKIISSYGKPFFDSSAIPSYFVSKKAREYVKVVLNGDGADELFAGYRRYVPLFYHLDKIAKFLPNITGYDRGIRYFLDRLIRASKASGGKWYNILLNDLFWIDGVKVKKFDEFVRSLKLNNFNKLLFLDFKYNLDKDLLMKMDIATMQNSLEARSPFLSKYFLETAFCMDGKIRAFKTKAILRELAKKYLPNEIVYAKKRGFEVPLKRWMFEDLRDVVFDTLKQGFYKNFIDIDIEKLKGDRGAKVLYLLFSLEVWYENYKKS
jgi:asparagine synthase (glutamine-hydrolysing)